PDASPIRHAASPVVVSDGGPTLPGDAQDERGDEESDDRIGDRGAGRDDNRAENHAGADDRVAARGVAVGDQRSAVQPAPAREPDAGGDRVADDTRTTRQPERQEVRRRKWVDD